MGEFNLIDHHNSNTTNIKPLFQNTYAGFGHQVAILEMKQKLHPKYSQNHVWSYKLFDCCWWWWNGGKNQRIEKEGKKERDLRENSRIKSDNIAL